MKTDVINQDFSKRDKIFRIINYILMVVFSLTCVGLSIYFKVIGDPNNRFLASVGVAVLFIIPILIELIFRCRLSNFVLIVFIVFSMLAGILGCVLNFYHTEAFKLNQWYDVFIHCLMGYIFSLVGLIFISRLEKKNKLSPWTIVLFCFFATLACELIWELMEWFADSFLSQTAQGIDAAGHNAPLVTDTNLDLLCNFSGGLIFVIQFVISKFTKLNLGMNYIEKELCTDKLISRRKKIKDEKAIDQNQSNTEDIESNIEKTEDTDVDNE